MTRSSSYPLLQSVSVTFRMRSLDQFHSPLSASRQYCFSFLDDSRNRSRQLPPRPSRQGNPHRLLLPCDSCDSMRHLIGRCSCARLLSTTAATTRTLLSDTERTSALSELSPANHPFPWEMDGTGRNAITKTFQFTNFVQAWEWMNQVAAIAEVMQHHPEWTNVYNTVSVTLSTHDAGGVTSLDITLAAKMNSLADQMLPTRRSV